MTIREKLERAAELVNGKAWGLEQRKPRIYLNPRKDVTVCFDFADAVYLNDDDEDGGASTLGAPECKVWLRDCGQHPKWYRSQRQKFRDWARDRFDAVVWFAATDNLEEAHRLLEEDRRIDDDIAGHLVNGRFDQARKAAGLAPELAE